MTLYIRSDEGVHLVDVLNPEYTLCGDAHVDSLLEDLELHGSWRQTVATRVTCERCSRIIESCVEHTRRNTRKRSE